MTYVKKKSKKGSNNVKKLDKKQEYSKLCIKNKKMLSVENIT